MKHKIIKQMTFGDHKIRHEELHRALDELCADFIGQMGKLPSNTPIYELMKWSHEQTINPTENKP